MPKWNFLLKASNKIISNPLVSQHISSYPEWAQEKFRYFRNLIQEVANDTTIIKEVTETLKWGEPSYVSKIGSTLRMDWKAKSPEQFSLYFICSTKLISTFRVVFKDIFQFEENRAIVFQKDDDIPYQELKKCILTTLTYKKVRDLPLLGL